MEKILIIGNGGHAKSVFESIRHANIYDFQGYVVKGGEDNRGNDILGTDAELEVFFQKGIRNAVIGIGYLGNSDIREIMYNKLKQMGFSLPTIIDPYAIIAENVQIDEGCFLGKRAIVNTSAKIEKMCIINTGAIVEHDCKVGSFSHISVGGIICGGVEVGKSSLIGANSVINQEICVGDNCVVGSGAVVVKDVPSGTRVVGNPAKEIF